MESYVEMEDRHEQKEMNPGETTGSLLSGKMAEVQKLKEKLMKAKDDAMQSWLDSRPLIDQLEKLQSELENMKNQTTISSNTISELESQLEATSVSIRSKKEEELKIRTMIDRINQDIDKTQEEMEELKTEQDEKHRARLQLKQVLRLRKQSLQALQLTLRATRLESEAHGASAAEAQGCFNCSQRDSTLVKLTQQDYQALITRAKEETSQAEWRIAASTEKRYAAEERRNSSGRRLQNLSLKGRTRERRTQSNGLSNQTIAPEVEVRPSEVRADHGKYGQKSRAKSSAQESRKKPQEQSRGQNSRNKYLSQKKKKSLLSRIRMFVLQKIRRFIK